MEAETEDHRAAAEAVQVHLQVAAEEAAVQADLIAAAVNNNFIKQQEA
jgi:hypothetical protein